MPASPPNVRPPPEEIRAYAARHHITLRDDEVEEFEAVIAETLTSYERPDELPDYRPRVEYTNRDPGYRPGNDADPLNAFTTKCEVKGADSGPLVGYEVGLKDNVNLAGVEMTLGSKFFEGTFRRPTRRSSPGCSTLARPLPANMEEILSSA